MYLLAIHAPIYIDHDRHFVPTDWKRILGLSRDSLSPYFGELVLIGPSLPIECATSNAAPETCQ